MDKIVILRSTSMRSIATSRLTPQTEEKNNFHLNFDAHSLRCFFYGKGYVNWHAADENFSTWKFVVSLELGDRTTDDQRAMKLEGNPEVHSPLLCSRDALFICLQWRASLLLQVITDPNIKHTNNPFSSTVFTPQRVRSPTFSAGCLCFSRTIIIACLARTRARERSFPKSCAVRTKFRNRRGPGKILKVL